MIATSALDSSRNSKQYLFLENACRQVNHQAKYYDGHVHMSCVCKHPVEQQIRKNRNGLVQKKKKKPEVLRVLEFAENFFVSSFSSPSYFLSEAFLCCDLLMHLTHS